MSSARRGAGSKNKARHPVFRFGTNAPAPSPADEMDARCCSCCAASTCLMSASAGPAASAPQVFTSTSRASASFPGDPSRKSHRGLSGSLGTSHTYVRAVGTVGMSMRPRHRGESSTYSMARFAMYPESRPTLMEISNMETSTPRHFGGEISAMYCGQMAKPRPTPRPQTSRPKNTDAKEPDSAMTNMPMAYSTIANLTHFTAPCLLYTTPPPIAPTALMKFRQPTATSSCDDVKSRSRDMGSSAPAMTPMSYPSSAAKMETVHTDWMASHSSVPLPSSPSRRVISGSGRSETLNGPDVACVRSASFARCCS
mmetsp:Transcript_2571/g.10740  ORF Transcript_2571/g.10740 Transcript_2571/m.10740 type:complete len:312 (-) Transcript_2571:175-1110(-)